MLAELLDAATKLEGVPASQITLEVVAKATKVVEEGEKIGVKVDWFNNVMGKILKMRDYYEFTQKVISIKGCMEVLQKQLDTLSDELKEEEGEMIK